MKKATAQRGFTLVEALIALSVFGAVALASITILSITLNGRQQIEIVSKKLGDLAYARTLLKEDLAQIIDRPVRSGVGGTEEASFYGGTFLGNTLLGDNRDRVLFSLTRLGNKNPDMIFARSSLSRVSYTLRQGDLYRVSSYYVDATAGTPVAEQLLFSGLKNFSIEFYAGRQWVKTFDSDRSDGWPRALRLQFDHPDYGPVMFLFLIDYQPTRIDGVEDE